MRNYRKMIKIIFTLIFFLSYNKILYAKNFNVNLGLSTFYANIKDPKYSFVNKYESVGNVNFSAGITKTFDKISLTLQTNRLGNRFIKRTVINNKTQKTLQNHSKLTADTLLVGYRYKRIVPALMLSNIKLEKSLYYNGILQGKSKQNTIITGLNLAYFITKNISSSVFYIMPNKKIYLKDSFGLGINYIF